MNIEAQVLQFGYILDFLMMSSSICKSLIMILNNFFLELQDAIQRERHVEHTLFNSTIVNF